MGRWTREQIPFPGVGGRAVSLGDIRIPTLAAVAQRDEIVPKAAKVTVPRILGWLADPSERAA